MRSLPFCGAVCPIATPCVCVCARVAVGVAADCQRMQYYHRHLQDLQVSPGSLAFLHSLYLRRKYAKSLIANK
jgi:hypothetical protein